MSESSSPPRRTKRPYVMRLDPLVEAIRTAPGKHFLVSSLAELSGMNEVAARQVA